MPDPSPGTSRESQPEHGVDHDTQTAGTGTSHDHHIFDRLHDLAIAVEHIVEHEESAETIEFRQRFDDWDRALDHYLEDRHRRESA